MIKILIKYTEDLEQLTANRIKERLQPTYAGIIPIEIKHVKAEEIEG